ncbi:MAG TPA: hypothetical protein VGN00_04185 [Puia sp.]|jgi:hypothetical protein
MRFLFCSSLFLFLACNTHTPAPADSNAQSGSVAKVFKQADFGIYHISAEADEKGQQSRLVVYNSVTQKKDILDLPGVETDSIYTRLTNLTHTVGFEKLALLLDWQGPSDNMHSCFIGYINDSLKLIYGDDYNDMIKELHRKDPQTITGISFCRDSLTQESIYCPLTISLPSGDAQILQPDTVALQFPTEAKEPIFAYRIGSSGKLFDYMIPTGTPFQIDTVFNVSGTVILSIGDSIRLQTKFDQLALKFKVSDAG